MSQQTVIDKKLAVTKLVVKSVAHDGYRRAGMAFSTGENILAAGTVTCSQLAMLEADPRLAVSGAEGTLAEAGASDDTPGTLVQRGLSDGVMNSQVAELGE
ncbi:HI1506-related protein [Photobacterium minamisatsumaniensis]|uniref:HI1506-related protein n=1 Tax=Photobacterium minamisatsumaniensis TaxID=2910233 RepID=UPI003D0E09AA